MPPTTINSLAHNNNAKDDDINNNINDGNLYRTSKFYHKHNRTADEVLNQSATTITRRPVRRTTFRRSKTPLRRSIHTLRNLTCSFLASATFVGGGDGQGLGVGFSSSTLAELSSLEPAHYFFCRFARPDYIFLGVLHVQT
jgi:hypothetical protein